MSTAEIILVWHQNAKGYIGKNGDLICRFPSDMKRFVELTKGHTVVMGRKTWESIPEKYRPLKDRFNIVMTKNMNYQVEYAQLAFDLVDVLVDYIDHRKIYVIGGAEIYDLFMPHADKLEITFSDDETEGDVKAPVIGDDWVNSDVTESFTLTNNDVNLFYENGKHFHFRTYERVKGTKVELNQPMSYEVDISGLPEGLQDNLLELKKVAEQVWRENTDTKGLSEEQIKELMEKSIEDFVKGFKSPTPTPDQGNNHG